MVIMDKDMERLISFDTLSMISIGGLKHGRG